jgi:hypothetical protein
MLENVDPIVEQVFAGVLGLTELDADASFIDLGGVSIEAEQIAARIAAILRIDVTGADILGHETVRQVSKLVADRLALAAR